MQSTQELEVISKRIEYLEEFQERVRLGQKWLLCLFATVGGVVATIYYMLSSWEIWLKQHH